MSKTRAAFELKGRMLSLTQVRVLAADPAAVQAQLQKLSRQMGQAAEGMPVVLDADEPFALASVIEAMRAVGLQPLAALEGPLAAPARACGLPVLPADLMAEAATKPRAAPPQAVEKPVYKPAMVVTEPVRSGQQIYADGRDLILLNAVGAGAEVIADGCVHVYGHLRGRAIAGARGETSARVFARRMEAELVAVAGVYAVAEQIPAALRGAVAQAYLDAGELKIERMDG